MLRKHRHDSVDKINRSCSFLCLTVKYRIRLHIVGHISYMYSYLIVSIWKSPQRKCIVKILGILRVYSESRDITHINTLRNLLGRDSGSDFKRRFINIFRIMIWQSEFCQNRMDLSIVFTGFAKNIYNFSLRIF